MEKIKKSLIGFWFFFAALVMCIQENIALLEGIGFKQETINFIRLFGVLVIFIFNYHQNYKKKP